MKQIKMKSIGLSLKIQIGKRDGDKIDKNKFSEKYKNCPSRQENKILWGLEIGNLENLPPLSICA